jgi:hypothetical protein
MSSSHNQIKKKVSNEYKKVEFVALPVKTIDLQLSCLFGFALVVVRFDVMCLYNLM